jgi:hypothetical protein
VSVFAEFHSPHVARAQSDHEAIEWHAPQGGGRVRVTEWTCDCLATFYELCQSGGVAFIRKTIQRDGSPETYETFRGPVRRVRKLWDELLTGQAR